MIRTIIAVGLGVLLLQGGVQAQDHTIIALSHSDFTAYELDPATGRIINQFKADNQPHESAVTLDGKTIFAAIPQGPHVVILDGETLKQIGKIESEYFTRPPLEMPQIPGQPPRPPSTSASPHGVALNRAASKLYIGVETSDVPGIVVYDVRAGRVSKKIDLLLEGGHFLAIDQQTDKLYYPHRADNRVVVIDTRTDQILKIIHVEGGPVGVAFSPASEAWVHSDYDGSVTVIDTRNDEVIDLIQTGGEGAGRIAVSPDGRFAASTHGGTEDVAIIDTQTRTVVASVATGPGPGFPLFSPGSDKLYVMNSRAGDVAVVDMKSMEVEARYAVGVNPFGGSIRSVGGR